MTAGVPSLQTVPSLPLTAWEQAAIIIIVLVVFVPLFLAAVRWLLNDQRRQQQTSQQTLLQQQQEFIEKRDAAYLKAQGERDQQWQTFLENQRKSDQDQRAEDRKSVAELAQLFKLLTSEVSGLANDFHEHDAMEKAKLDEMSATIHATDTSRRKKGTQG